MATARLKRKRDSSEPPANANNSSTTSSSAAKGSGEMYFPRGGANVLTPIEMRRIHQKADKDFLFEMTSESGKKKKKSKKAKTSAADGGSSGASANNKGNNKKGKKDAKEKSARQKEEEELEALVTAQIPKKAVALTRKVNSAFIRSLQ